MTHSAENTPAKDSLKKDEITGLANQAYTELENSIYNALLTYSNVHRGKGHFSQATTHLYEKAREMILEHLDLDKKQYIALFLSPRRAETLINALPTNSFYRVSSAELGLPLGIVALAVDKKELIDRTPVDKGGGTTKLTSREWVIWDDAPDKFEAGTPSVINVIAFAKALSLTKKYGKHIFHEKTDEMSVFEILYKDTYQRLHGKELLKKLQDEIIGREVKVPTTQGLRPFINLDNSASTPALTPVWNSYRRTLKLKTTANNVTDEVKGICASFINASMIDYDIIFTSNTTESVNMVANSYSNAVHEGLEPVIVNSILEHSSNDLPWRFVPGSGLIRLAVDDDGLFDIAQLKSLLIDYNRLHKFGNKRINLVALSGASNVLGICNDFEEIRTLTKEYGALLLIDAAQLIAHKKIDINQCNPDFLAFSAHKIYAPFGCGVLIARKGLISDEELSLANKSGDENYAGIAALGKSLVLMDRIGMNTINAEENIITKKAINGLSAIKGMKIYGAKDTQADIFSMKLGVIAFTIGNRIPHSIAKDLAVHGGIGVRSGCHCAHLIVKKLVGMTPFFEKFQWAIQKLFPKVSFPGVVRVSFGLGTREEDIDVLVKTLSSQSNHRKTSSTDKEIKDFIKQIEMKVFA